MLTKAKQVFYTYIWFDPRNNAPFYVGKGSETEKNLNNQSFKRANRSVRKLENASLKSAWTPELIRCTNNVVIHIRCSGMSHGNLIG